MIRVFRDLEGISLAAAKVFADAASHAINARSRFGVALSGGGTPRRLYEILAAKPYHEKIQWKAVHVFWSDERCVPPGDERSNYRMACESLLNHVPIPTGNIHPVHGELPPAESASRYEAGLRAFFGAEPAVFDLILLGLGEDAHTASLFPRTPVLAEEERWVAEVYIPKLETNRITLTAPLINHARQVIFLVSGASKAAALHSVLEGAHQPQEFPAQLIRPGERPPLWLVDKAASHKLAMELEMEEGNQ